MWNTRGPLGLTSLMSVFPFLIAAPLQARDAPCPRMRSVSELAAGLAAAWNAGDAERWSSLYARDADFVNIAGLLFSGREAIRTRHVTVFAEQYAGSRLTLRVRRVEPLGRDHALLETDAELRPAPAAGGGQPAAPLKTLFTFVVARGVACGWRVRFSQNTLVAHASSPAK